MKELQTVNPPTLLRILSTTLDLQTMTPRTLLRTLSITSAKELQKTRDGRPRHHHHRRNANRRWRLLL